MIMTPVHTGVALDWGIMSFPGDNTRSSDTCRSLDRRHDGERIGSHTQKTVALFVLLLKIPTVIPDHNMAFLSIQNVLVRINNLVKQLRIAKILSPLVAFLLL